jgi:four helix bundle protein
MALAKASWMPPITSFRDLIAWQKAMDLADVVYDVTEAFPRREWFGLAYQMQKSAVSIPSNIAEGHRRRTPGYIHHLEISLGSHGELDTQCELAARRLFLKPTDRIRVEALLEEVGKLTHGLLRSLAPDS